MLKLCKAIVAMGFVTCSAQLACAKLRPIFISESQDESTSKLLQPWSLELATQQQKKVLMDAPNFGNSPWRYFSSIDYGVRNDDFGDGRFQTARTGGVHSGIDFLMPEGTDLYAPCTGLQFTGSDGGYGHWVQVVCSLNVTNQIIYVSLLFAHLKSIDLRTPETSKSAGGVVVEKGTRIGKSGRSGNASAPGILPHLHLETAFHFGLEDAIAERHSKTPNTMASFPAKTFLARLRDSCYKDELPKGWDLAVGSRLDPFLVMKCLTPKKPKFSVIGSNTVGISWEKIYSFTGRL
jgi:hypothetical protein